MSENCRPNLDLDSIGDSPGELLKYSVLGSHPQTNEICLFFFFFSFLFKLPSD